MTVDASADPIPLFQGDGADDNLVLSVSAGKIAHNLPAAQGFELRDRPGRGHRRHPGRQRGGREHRRPRRGQQRRAHASALGNTYNSLEIQGEAGDDLVTGGGKADTLGGGEGDDRVVGAQGGDTMSGGAGNDVLVWNNGDGSDTMDGDAGNDEIEVNGSANAGDEFTIAPRSQRANEVRPRQPGAVHAVRHARRADDGQRAGWRRKDDRCARGWRGASCSP